MGWLFDTQPMPKKTYVQQLLDRNFSGEHCKLLGHSLRGNQLWVLVQPQQEDPFIGLLLLECHDGCWGYKDMDESMGPYYYDCPLGFLERAPEPPYCPIDGHLGSRRTWRDHVRDHHAAIAQRRKSRPKVGDRIELPPDFFPVGAGSYQVTADLGRRGLLLNHHTRLPARAVRYVRSLQSQPSSSND